MTRPMLLFVLTALGLAAGCESTTMSAPDATACGSTAPPECYATADGFCGDSLNPPVCSNGAWVCPAGSTRGSACRCFIAFANDASGACTCGASGWECPDAGPVAPRLEACGDTVRCDRNAEYCQQSSGGPIAGTRYACRPIPAACIVEPSCACLAPEPGAGECRPVGDGSFVVTINTP